MDNEWLKVRYIEGISYLVLMRKLKLREIGITEVIFCAYYSLNQKSGFGLVSSNNSKLSFICFF